MAPLRIAALISGRGSNMRALVDDLNQDGSPARIVHVVANNPAAEGLRFAVDAQIATSTVDHRLFSDRPAFDAALTDILEQIDVNLVCLAGFMRVLGSAFVRRWSGRLINIHPSLLPAYPGLHTHTRAITDRAVESGCTVHWVTEGVDQGPIIAQRRVPVFADDTGDTLAARVLAQEHQLYPSVVRAIADRTVRFTSEPSN